MLQAPVQDEYDLILSADPNPKQHAFWFFFRVSGPGLIAKVRTRHSRNEPSTRAHAARSRASGVIASTW